jgi:hypothetical protein
LVRDKTPIGRIERGFDFLRYAFSRGPLRVAHQTIQNHAARIHRLYEKRKKSPAIGALLDEYVPRWNRWCTTGLKELWLSVPVLVSTATHRHHAQQAGPQNYE